MDKLNYSKLSDRKRFYKSRKWQRKRIDILQRDNYECQWCKQQGKVVSKYDTTLIVHHVTELKDRPDLKMEDSNLITVCFNCHEIHHERIFNSKPKWNDERW